MMPACEPPRVLRGEHRPDDWRMGVVVDLEDGRVSNVVTCGKTLNLWENEALYRTWMSEGHYVGQKFEDDVEFDEIGPKNPVVV